MYMIFNCSIAAKSAKCTYNWTTLCIFTSTAAILNISNRSSVATCHPPGIVQWDAIDE